MARWKSFNNKIFNKSNKEKLDERMKNFEENLEKLKEKKDDDYA